MKKGPNRLDNDVDSQPRAIARARHLHMTIRAIRGCLVEYRFATGADLSRSSSESPMPLPGEVDESWYYGNRPAVPQQRQLNRMQDEGGNLRRISFSQPPSPPRNLHTRTVSIGTQTVDEERQRRDANAPPPSSINSSQQTYRPSQDNHENRANGAEDAPTPASVEEILRPLDIPLLHPPAEKIDLFVSYDVFPGRNAPFHPVGGISNIFTYSLDRFLQQANWQSAPEVLLVCLEAPGRTHMDLVFKNDEDRFGLVMRRFKQVALRLKADYRRLKMDAVIEIVLEPVVKGHSHSLLVDAWWRAGTNI
ncbi:hypothetical protein NW768_009754 [Fusarium equiseti]|uniref:Uncharacterized protein n=1 Tax=Fusarium equiseti TaxID=61235 RepID=A0ABQ8R1W2_FUSEQ|nr:hypothetical protein NW768_009754 [Fusarium equiseti]